VSVKDDERLEQLGERGACLRNGTFDHHTLPYKYIRDDIRITVAISRGAAFCDGDRDTGRSERISKRDRRRKERKGNEDEIDREAHVQQEWEML
jgi:hypothetical protein